MDLLRAFLNDLYEAAKTLGSVLYAALLMLLLFACIAGAFYGLVRLFLYLLGGR